MPRPYPASLLAVLGALVPVSPAQRMSFPVELRAGAQARHDVPVTLELRVGSEIPAGERLPSTVAWAAVVQVGPMAVVAQPEVLRGEHGAIEGFDVRWIESFMAADEQVRRTVVLRPAGEGETASGFRLDEAEGRLDLVCDDQPVWRHVTVWDPERYDETYKPFHHLFAFDGEGFLTKGPGGTHSHHRGIFLGWSKTRSGEAEQNFWHMPGSGRPYQRHTAFDPQRTSVGDVFARSVSTTRWITDGGQAVVEDERDLITWRMHDGWLLDFRITLRSLAGEVTLDGDPPHAGFQFRAAQSVADAQACTYVLPQSATGGENDNWSDCPWAAARFPIGGRRYEVLLIDHPENPRPTVFNTRSYGRFGPFFRHTLHQGEPLVVRYRLRVRALTAGQEPSRQALEEDWRNFVEPPTAVVAR